MMGDSAAVGELCRMACGMGRDFDEWLGGGAEECSNCRDVWGSTD